MLIDYIESPLKEIKVAGLVSFFAFEIPGLDFGWNACIIAAQLDAERLRDPSVFEGITSELASRS